MSGLTLIEGSERAAQALSEGKTIVDFLTSPFFPCAVYRKGGLIAVNHGNVPGADRFRSFFWTPMDHPLADVYSVEYMSGEKIVLKFRRSWMPPPKPENAEVIISQAGASRLCYEHSELTIAQAFENAGYRIGGEDSVMFGALRRRAMANLEARAQEIKAAYECMRAAGE